MLSGLSGIGILTYAYIDKSNENQIAQDERRYRELERNPRKIIDEHVALWWDAVPDSVVAATQVTGSTSNIKPDDYCGPESCMGCHPANYEG